jgi:hypothetical protein
MFPVVPQFEGEHWVAKRLDNWRTKAQGRRARAAVVIPRSVEAQ